MLRRPHAHAGDERSLSPGRGKNVKANKRSDWCKARTNAAEWKKDVYVDVTVLAWGTVCTDPPSKSVSAQFDQDLESLLSEIPDVGVPEITLTLPKMS